MEWPRRLAPPTRTGSRRKSPKCNDQWYEDLEGASLEGEPGKIHPDLYGDPVSYVGVDKDTQC